MTSSSHYCQMQCKWLLKCWTCLVMLYQSPKNINNSWACYKNHISRLVLFTLVILFKLWAYLTICLFITGYSVHSWCCCAERLLSSSSWCTIRCRWRGRNCQNCSASEEWWTIGNNIDSYDFYYLTVTVNILVLDRKQQLDQVNKIPQCILTFLLVLNLNNSECLFMLIAKTMNDHCSS